MNPFVEQHQDEIGCVLSCFDRVVITGTFPDICHARAMAGYLGARSIRLFDYTQWAEPLRDEIRTNAERVAAEAGLEIEFIGKIKAFRKEDRIHDILAERATAAGSPWMQPCASKRMTGAGSNGCCATAPGLLSPPSGSRRSLPNA